MAPPSVLVVDDDPEVLDTLVDFLVPLGLRVRKAGSGEAALRAIEAEPPDIVLTDVHMPVMNGLELTRRIKEDPRWQLIPVVILTAIGDLSARVQGLSVGADDFFSKPVEFVELRARLSTLLRVKGLTDDLEQAEHVISALCLTIEARDPYTGGHCARLADFAQSVGRALGVDEPTHRALRLAGYLHDLGKIAVSDAVLLKPGRLDEAERALIRRHPGVGADLLADMRTLDLVRPMVRHHHERMDGSGYPDRLVGEAIPLGARIVSVVDVYDALSTARPYKPALPQPEALRILRRETDAGAWDARIVDALVALLRARGVS